MKREAMRKLTKQSQVVVRVPSQLDRRIEAAAGKKGLTKAAWVRQLIIETLDAQEAVAKPSLRAGGNNDIH